MITTSYVTLTDGTLVDIEEDAGVTTVRVGRSLTPHERPVVLVLTKSEAREVAVGLVGSTDFVAIARRFLAECLDAKPTAHDLAGMFELVWNARGTADAKAQSSSVPEAPDFDAITDELGRAVGATYGTDPIIAQLRLVWHARGAAIAAALQSLADAVRVLDELEAKREHDYQDGVRDDECDRAAYAVIDAARALLPRTPLPILSS